MKTKVLFLLLSITFYCNSQFLDATFGLNGSIITQNYSDAPSYDTLGSAKLQVDGKVVYVGRNNGLNSSFVARTNIDGTLDASFNFNGVKILEGIRNIGNLAIQLDGKIIIAGNNSVYRLNSDGSNDVTFANNGFLYINPNYFLIKINTIISQPNGKILLVGNSSNKFAAVRLNLDGSFDTSFSGDGISITAIGTGVDNALAAVLQTNGKTLIAGYTQISGAINGIAILRLNIDGTIDATFGNFGAVIYGDGINKIGHSIDVQSDGKIVVLATSVINMVVFRFNINGSLDTGFGSSGFANTAIPVLTSSLTTSFASNSTNLKTLPNDKILISATSNNDYCVAQLNNNGSFDSTFGSNGITIVNYSAADKSCYLIAKPNGKILTGGTNLDTTVSASKIVNLQLSSSGILEATTTFNALKTEEKVISIVEQVSGKTIILFESINAVIGSNSKLMRYNIDGSLDLTFGTAGLTTTNFNFSTKLLLQPDNKIVVCDGYNIERYTSDGLIDTSFGVNGMTDFSMIVNNPVSYINNLAIDSNSKIYLALDVSDNVAISAGVIKLNTNGTIDTTFGINGLASQRFNVFGFTDFEYATSICIQSNNDIVLAGFTRPNPSNSSINTSLGIMKFNSNGILDNSFGVNGKYVFQNTLNLYPQEIISLANNKILFSSMKFENGLFATTTNRLNSNGTVDDSFYSNSNTIDGYYTNQMIVQNDGKIVKVGSIGDKFSISRYEESGVPDAAFGNLGNFLTAVNVQSSINTVCKTFDNKLLVGGYAINNQNKMELALARYTDTNIGILNFFLNNNKISIYPNPIESLATFDYDLKKSENVSIDIFDMQGKKIKAIATNKNLELGNHKQKLDLSNGFASGNYILMFSTNSESQSIQITKK